MLPIIVAMLLSLLCAFLILLILIQRGKGGGLAGAFGGMGGQSAFGTKAGDTFMRVTIVAAAVWFLMCIGIHIAFKPSDAKDSGLFSNKSAASSTDSGVGTGERTGAGAGASANTETQSGTTAD